MHGTQRQRALHGELGRGVGGSGRHELDRQASMRIDELGLQYRKEQDRLRVGAAAEQPLPEERDRTGLL